jgi:hypothetical protein
LEREPLKVSFRQNPFYWALYAARNDGSIDSIADKDMSRFAAQMMYADRHDIPPELLVGFIYQQGSEAELTRKLRSREFEPWYRGAGSRRPRSQQGVEDDKAAAAGADERW